MKYLYVLLAGLLFLACSNSKTDYNYKSVTVTPILKDSLLSIRAIDILDDGNLAFAANKNTFGIYNTQTQSLQIGKQKYDSLELQFRAVAHTKNDFFMLSVGNPALLYKTGSNGNMELVYSETHKNVFYDAMHFWNDNEGIAMGDPLNKDCLSILITRNGGKNWTKTSCEELPKVNESEAAFAASNTNITSIGDATWIATGGTSSRVFFSPDKGKTWRVYNTPITQNKATTGIYSIAFYDQKNGFAIGGDYTNPTDNSANKIKTTDGGKTWQLVAQNKTPGYRSCVQYVPNSSAKALVTVGFKGIDFSNDAGETWTHISDESFYTIRFINDKVAFAAGKGRIAKLRFN